MQSIDEINAVQMMKWWWGDRAWWVIESVFLHSLDKGLLGMFSTCSDGQKYGFALQNTVSLSLGQIILRVTKAEVTPFVSRERPNVKH